MEKVKDEIQSTFKFHGYTVKSEACNYLLEMLIEVPDVKERAQWIDKIIDSLAKQSLDSAVLEQEVLEIAVNDCTQQDNDTTKAGHLEVIDIFSVPRFMYDNERKKFLERSVLGFPKPQLFGNPDSKALLYKSRYTVVEQRTLRHPLFTPSVVPGLDDDATKFKLKKVEDLLASATKIKGIVVLGMLTQLKADKFYLEDPTGFVELDLSSTTFHTGLFTENSIVLAEGAYYNHVLHVTAMGFAPIEAASTSRQFFGKTNFFGGEAKTCVRDSQKLKLIEAQNQDATLVFLSDVWLDDEAVLESLQRLFRGFEDSTPPVCFVFCGSFCSKSYGKKRLAVLKESFGKLAQMLSEFPQLLGQSQFVFVPSTHDPTIGNILPRPPLPESVTSDFQRQVPNCHFTSNPCRIRYCTQEIVVFREDLVEKMCRNCIQMPSLQKEIPQHLSKTIQSQSHLSPLPLHVSPVYWDYDHCLGLYPLPDLVVVCDKVESFTQTDNNRCTITNPGSFARGGFSFQVYIPANRQIEDSAVQ